MLLVMQPCSVHVDTHQTTDDDTRAREETGKLHVHNPSTATLKLHVRRRRCLADKYDGKKTNNDVNGHRFDNNC